MIVYNKKVAVLIIKYHNSEISKSKKSYNLKIYGKSIINWTKDALRILKPNVVLINKNNTLNLALKKHYSSDYIAVFYYDTPLLTENVATTCIDYAVLKELDVCRLPKGFVFKTDYLKNQQSPVSKQSNTEQPHEKNHKNNTTHKQSNFFEKFDEQNADNSNMPQNKQATKLGYNKTAKSGDNGNINHMQTKNEVLAKTQDFNHFQNEFLQAYNLNNLNKIEKSIKQKIINHHKQNGVMFVDDGTVFIDYDCKIGDGCVVYPNNFILNGSKISKNCTIMPGNIIDNCTVYKGLTLTYSVLTNSKISKQYDLPPFSVVENNVLIK